MKRIGWIAMLLCMALVMTGCSNSDDQNGKPDGDDSAPATGSATGGDGSGTAGGSGDLGTGTEAAAKSMAGKGGAKVTQAVGKALKNSVTGSTNKDNDLDKAPKF